MSKLPITRLTLYKHGVGFFERRLHFTGERADLTFRVEEMNDVLKSLTALDWGGGKVLSIVYATPQTRSERLEGCSVHLDDQNSLLSLLQSLRGQQVRLHLSQSEDCAGLLLGCDLPGEDQPLNTVLVSLLAAESSQVRSFPLSRLEGVEIQEERGLKDLRFFLETVAVQERYRKVDILLSPGEHDLSVSYIAPAPTWRVSYRLVAESGKEGTPGCSLLLGWGIFDNQLEEDLENVSLNLVAGMPVSFIYDLYHPFTPERPEIKEQGRAAAGPVEFERSIMSDSFGDPPAPAMMAAPMAAPAPQAKRSVRTASLEEMAAASPPAVAAKELGELFAYQIETPVSVGRGQSAMAPILSTRLEYHKDLLYNASSQPSHPVATLRLENTSGLALERGPLTVLEDGEYVGEALLPFIPNGGEIVVPYAVELSVKISEHPTNAVEIRSLSIERSFLRVEEWQIQRREYRIHNQGRKDTRVLIEHPRRVNYSLFETADPKERTDRHLRFEVDAPAGKETSFFINERNLISRYEEIRKQSFDNLAVYLRRNLLDAPSYNKIVELLRMWEQIEDIQRKLIELTAERDKIYRAQTQIQGNMQALGASGKEGALRTRYVEELETGENQLKVIAAQEAAFKTERQRLEDEITRRLKAFEK